MADCAFLPRGIIHKVTGTRHTTPMTLPPVENREMHQRITPADKLQAELRAFALDTLRVFVISLILVPLLCASFLTLDLPVRFFNPVFTFMRGLVPSVWLTLGHVIMAVAPIFAVLVTRRFGGVLASRAVMISWFAVALLILFELSVLADVIEAGDFPGTRFVTAFVASAMTGQLVTIAFYDVARGGGAWWRAPFYALMAGYGVTAALYFPVAFGNTALPWGGWLVGDLMIRLLMAMASLPLYAFLRPMLTPRGGYGGR
ncbi:MAG: hypothetical protein AAFQ29_08885 [Pseudomonadota bacterium]